MKRNLLSLASILSVVALAGCGGGHESGGGFNGPKTILKATVYAAGYGTQWIESAIEVFQKDHPNVEFELEANQLAIDSVRTQLEYDNCQSDIVLVYAQDYETFAKKGYLEDVTDIYETKIPDQDKKVKDVILPQLLNARLIDGDKYYGIPWQANNASGLIYNKDLFDEYNWEIPETMEEFFGLCDQIAEDTGGSVAPFTYGGSDSYGYLLNNLSQWLCECYGYDAMLEFLELESPEVYSNQEAGRTKIYQTIAKMLRGQTSSGTPYALEKSEGALASTAQTNFINGAAAMIPSGPFFLNEMQEYIELKNIKVGYMPMPHINSDKKSLDGTLDTSKIRISTDNGVFAIPASSEHKDLAKEFLLSMFTSESYTSFVAATNGLNRPIKGVNVDTTKLNDFGKAAFEYFNAGDEAGETLYVISKDGLIEKYSLSIFLAYNGDFISFITAKKTYEEALEIANGCVANEMAIVNGKWDPITRSW